MNDSSICIIDEIEKIQSNVKAFKERSKLYYFDVLFTKYRCPVCNRRFQISDSSQAKCICGNSFDPTIEFQRSVCCNANLTRQIFHYVCSNCGKYVKSIFLFDERLFDINYFREMMARSRERKRRRAEMLNRVIRERSHELILFGDFKPEFLDGLSEDLNDLINTNSAMISEEINTETDEFDMLRYWHHILLGLHDEILFSRILPISKNSRKDRIWRFITLIFMEHEQKIWLTQYDNDILVEKYETHS